MGGTWSVSRGAPEGDILSISRDVSRLMKETDMWGAFLSFTDDFLFAQNSPTVPLPSGAVLSTGGEFPESRSGVPLWDFQS